MEDQFETFWKAYPRRISKGTARKAFANAIRKTTLETMLAALKEYVAHKPAYQDYKHPSTWLNGECWEDDWTPPPVSMIQPQGKRTLADALRDRQSTLGSGHSYIPNDGRFRGSIQ